MRYMRLMRLMRASDVAPGYAARMSWRVFLWMSVPWLALWPGLWVWLPEEPALVTIALRTLLVTAPLCLLQPLIGLNLSTLIAAWSIACAGLAGAYLMEERGSDLWSAALLLGIWILALRSTRIESRAEVARVRIAAFAILFAPLLGEVFASRTQDAFSAATPWNWNHSATSIFQAWPALVLCAVLALSRIRWRNSLAVELAS